MHTTPRRAALTLIATAALATPALATATAATTAPASATSATTASGCVRQFRTALRTHLDAIADKDLTALAPTIGEGIVLVFPDGSVLRGKDAFLDYHEEWFADPLWRMPTTVTDVEVQGCHSAWVLLDAHYVALDPDGSVLGEATNRVALTWTREKGRWVVVADQNTRVTS